MTDEYTDLFDAPSIDTNKRIEELAYLIRYHRNLYYNGTSEITDEEFDAYVDEIRELDPVHVVLTEVGASTPDDSPWTTGRHGIAMTSLDKVNTREEMKEWVRKRNVKWLCPQEKLDGFSLSFSYLDGVLQKVLTRGGGEEGEDITRNALKMRGVKRVLSTRFTGDLRGEAMFVAPEFAAYNAKAASTKNWTVFKNMRNGASGLARRHSGEGVEFLRVFFYELKSDVLDFNSHFEKMSYLRKILGLWTPWYARVDLKSLEEIYDKYESEIRENLIYEIDGLVIKVDSASECEDIESTMQTSSRATANPKSQVAWKFMAETRVTKLLRVVADFGLGGRLTPVAEVEPVIVGGVEVRRATLHNWGNVQNLNLKNGCKILLKRAGDVIPAVLRRLDDEGTPVEIPTSCPKCVSTLITDGEYLRCVNTSCPGIIAGNVRKWVTNLEIDFFGMAIIEAMVATGKLKTVADLYHLTEQDIADECGSGNARRAVANLQAKSVVPIHLLFGSLNITNFGRSLAKLLVKAGYDTVDKMLAATITDMAKVEKFGVERATQVWNGLREMETVVRDLEKLITIQTATPKAGGILSGKSFCITGSLSQPKKVFQDMIESNGGEYLDSVKSGLTYLIAADPTGTSGKLDSARKKGIQVIGEDDLMVLLVG